MEKFKLKTLVKSIKQAPKAVSTGLLTVASTSAFALPAADTITQPLKDSEALIESTGGGMISIAVLIAVFAIIITMIFRKGR